MSTSGDTKNAYRWHHTLHPSLKLVSDSPANGLPSLITHAIHPTHASLGQHPSLSAEKLIAWRSRSHRKNRYRTSSPTRRDAHNPRSRTIDNVWQGLAHMTRLEYWNISWWVAMAFTTGSITWVINGFAAFLPFADPDKFTAESLEECMGWTAWLGATIFEVGSVLGMWEAWNRDDAAGFGWEVANLVHGRKGVDEEKQSNADGGEGRRPKRKWIWFTTNKKYFRELGFLAAFAQLIAASIFWISGFTAIPTIQDAIKKRVGLIDGVFWTPQVVGGTGFIVSATFLLLETQKKWYLPHPRSLGWQVGFWNLIGAIGFTLCGALGYPTSAPQNDPDTAASPNTAYAYESSLSTFWGGWAFLIGSLIQLYESVNSDA